MITLVYAASISTIVGKWEERPLCDLRPELRVEGALEKCGNKYEQNM